MSVFERMRVSLGGALLRAGKSQSGLLQFAPPWARHAFMDGAFRLLAREGYKANATVYACVQVWAQTLPEPPLGVKRTDRDGAEEWLHEHPARVLMNRPNPFMGEDEFWSMVATYLVIGGACYVYKERARNRRPIALWPLHAGQMREVPGVDSSEGWISHYLYDPQDGTTPMVVPPEDVIRLTWAIDPENPTHGLSGLVAARFNVDTENEIIRYVFAYLKNDAAPSVVVALKDVVGKGNLQRLKKEYRDTFGGERRGEPMWIEGSEATVTRVGAHLQELAIEALYNVPQSAIAAALEVPPGLAGLNVALQRPQGLGSVGDAQVKEFTSRRVVPRLRRIASQFTAQLLPDFGSAAGLSMEFDLSKVQALREDRTALIGALNGGVTSGWLMVNDARRQAGEAEVPGGNVFLRSFSVIEVPAEPPAGAPAGEGSGTFTGIQIDKARAIILDAANGVITRDDGIQQLIVFLGLNQAQAEAVMGDAGKTPPVLPAPTPALPPPTADDEADAGDAAYEGDGSSSEADVGKEVAIPERKAVSAAARDRARRIAGDAQRRRAALADAAADVLEEAFAELGSSAAKEARSGATIVDRLVEAAALKKLHDVIRGSADATARDAYAHAAQVLGVELEYDAGSKAMQAVFDAVGARIKDIDGTTRDRLQGYLDVAHENHWTPAETAKHIEADESGAFNRARAELVGRTETAMVYAGSSCAAYRESGRVEQVVIFDGDDCGWEGHDDPDKADGSVRSLDDYEAMPIAHPNCTRAAAPYIELGDEEG